MKSKKLIVFGSMILAVVSWLPEGFTLEKPTHEYLNQQIAQRTVNVFSLDAYLKNNLGFKGGAGEPILAYSEAKKRTMKRAIFEWMGEGGIKEDEPEQIWRQIVGIRKRGTLLTELNNYSIEVTIPESETLMESLCHARRDSMLPEPFTMLSSGGPKSAGSLIMTRTGKTSSNDWAILPKRQKPGSTPGPY